MSFSSIKGQEGPIEYLKSCLRQDRIAKAYIFMGPEGVGKNLVAGEFARAIECLTKEDDACDSCESCRKIEKGNHPDIHTIDFGDEEIKVEFIRQLQREISFKAYEGKKKVFIIRNCHNLNPTSASAFLKTLEEPSGDSVIILITEKPAYVLRTILSRCQAVKFSPLPRQALEEILKKEYQLDADSAHFLSFFSEGRLGNALKLKDTNFIK